MEIRPFTLGVLFLSLTIAAALPCAYGQPASTFPYNLPAASMVNCWFFGVTFQANQGQSITFQWAENLSSAGPISMNFYVVPESSFSLHWYCIWGGGLGAEYVYWADGASGVTNWLVPWTDVYAAILVNSAHSPISGTLSLTTPNGTVSATPLGPSTVIPCRTPCRASTRAA